MYESVLVATDGSDDAALAVDHAAELARRFDAALLGVAVVETRTEYDNAIVDPEEVHERLERRARRALEAVEGRGATIDRAVETELRRGVPHEEILAVADERGADLLVVGASGRSSFRRALLGSTVDALVRLSPVPVLVVGEGEEGRGDG